MMLGRANFGISGRRSTMRICRSWSIEKDLGRIEDLKGPAKPRSLLEKNEEGLHHLHTAIGVK